MELLPRLKACEDTGSGTGNIESTGVRSGVTRGTLVWHCLETSLGVTAHEAGPATGLAM